MHWRIRSCAHRKRKTEILSGGLLAESGAEFIGFAREPWPDDDGASPSDGRRLCSQVGKPGILDAPGTRRMVSTSLTRRYEEDKHCDLRTDQHAPGVSRGPYSWRRL